MSHAHQDSATDSDWALTGTGGSCLPPAFLPAACHCPGKSCRLFASPQSCCRHAAAACLCLPCLPALPFSCTILEGEDGQAHEAMGKPQESPESITCFSKGQRGTVSCTPSARIPALPAPRPFSTEGEAKCLVKTQACTVSPGMSGMSWNNHHYPVSSPHPTPPATFMKIHMLLPATLFVQLDQCLFESCLLCRQIVFHTYMLHECHA